MYIATNHDLTAIFGMGETPDAAIREADTCGHSSRPVGYPWRIYEATDYLADQVREMGGERVSWRITEDGVAHGGELD